MVLKLGLGNSQETKHHITGIYTSTEIESVYISSLTALFHFTISIVIVKQGPEDKG